MLKATVRVANSGPAPATFALQFTLVDDKSGLQVASASAAAVTLAAGAVLAVRAPRLALGNPARWSVRRPATYTLRTAVHVLGAAPVDAVNTTVGFREARFDASAGFFLNGEHVVLRGFSDHNSFAGVGVAVPARVNLYRAQMLRAVGGNAWRMSHNPPDPAVLDLLDALGVLVWDETRDFTLAQVRDMADLVKRPVQPQFRVLVCAAPALNAAG